MNLLDPRASDRFLRAYALLASEYAAGAKSAVDSLMPFVRRAVEASSGSQFNAKDISEYVEETYRVRIPIYMMDAFKHKLIDRGHLQRPDNAPPDILICNLAEVRPEVEETLNATLDTESLQSFEAALTKFSLDFGLDKPYASQNWGEALIKFFAGWDEKKTAVVDRQLIYDSKRLDDRVVSSFIGTLDTKSANYEIAKKLYFGVIVADFFNCIAEVSEADSLQSVDVVLDTTLLMRLLGTSGELLREATEELIRDIQNLGGTAYYFTHTYEELIESLEALAYQAGNRLEMNRESAHALAAGETSPGKIQMLAREADIRLGELGVTQHGSNYVRGDNRFQIDEEEFVRKIGGVRFEERRTRWERDAMSLALISRLRKDKRTRRLGESVAIFITHNGKLARTAREFLGFSSFDVPPILTTDQVSVLAWLERGGGVNENKLSAKLAAACYEAVIPREGWEAQFWQKMEELKASDEYKVLLNSQLVENSMRTTILDRTFGEPSLARQLELGPILKEVAEKARQESLQNRNEGVEEGASRVIAEIESRRKARSKLLARRSTDIVLAFAFFAVLLLYLIPAVRVMISPDERNHYYFINAATAILLSLVTLLAFFGIAPTARGIRQPMERFFESMIFRFMAWLV